MTKLVGDDFASRFRLDWLEFPMVQRETKSWCSQYDAQVWRSDLVMRCRGCRGNSSCGDSISTTMRSGGITSRLQLRNHSAQSLPRRYTAGEIEALRIGITWNVERCRIKRESKHFHSLSLLDARPRHPRCHARPLHRRLAGRGGWTSHSPLEALSSAPRRRRDCRSRAARSSGCRVEQVRYSLLLDAM